MIMTEVQYMKAQLVWSRKLVAAYEEEAREADILELERQQIMKKLQENSAKFDQLKLKMEGYRRDIRDKAEELRKEYESEEEGGEA